MRKILSAMLLSALLLSACGAANAEMNIVCSLFPQYDFTRAIVGDHAVVTQLLPPGMDSHGYEPSAREMVMLNSSSMLIYTDPELENWIASLLDGLTDVTVVRAAEGIDLEALNEIWEAEYEDGHEHEEEHEGEHHEHKYDAHVWLDPTLAIKMCENIRDALIAYDPANRADYEANCAAYVEKLAAMDAEFKEMFENAGDVTLYFGGRFAYSHFIRHYGLRYESAYASCSSEADPGTRTIVGMVTRMNEAGAKVIFTDELTDGSVAQAIAGQSGAKVLVFHTAHNLSAEDRDAGLTYLDIMYRNMKNVKAALE